MHNTSSSGKISVIIPALNEEKLIKGILEQFSADVKLKYGVEVIVSDGGSFDLTAEISRSYADKTVSDKENPRQNISHGRNFGAANSMGDVLIFLNADVLIKDPVYFLEEVVKFGRDFRYSALACRIKIIPDEERLSDKMFHAFYNSYTAFLNKFVTGMGRGECHIVKRNKFFEINGYDESIAAGEDFDLYRRLRKNGKVIFRSDLVVYESPRRYRKYGYPAVIWEWTRNAISVILTGKSVSKKWEAVR